MGVFRFVKFKRLLEIEAGFTQNEPAQLCVADAIESAVIHLIVKGILGKHWQLAKSDDINSSILQAYIKEQESQLSDKDVMMLERRLQTSESPEILPKTKSLAGNDFDSALTYDLTPDANPFLLYGPISMRAQTN